MEGLAVVGGEVLFQDLTSKTLSDIIDSFMAGSIAKNLEIMLKVML